MSRRGRTRPARDKTNAANRLKQGVPGATIGNWRPHSRSSLLRFGVAIGHRSLPGTPVVKGCLRNLGADLAISRLSLPLDVATLGLGELDGSDHVAPQASPGQ